MTHFFEEYILFYSQFIKYLDEARQYILIYIDIKNDFSLAKPSNGNE